MNKRTLIIGAGGVGNVVVHKCAQNTEIFGEIMLASRNENKCRAIAADVKNATGVEIKTARVDADNVQETVALMQKFQPQILINVALPYQDLPLMDACLHAGVHYVDTANYEPPNHAHFEYSWQWAYQERFKKAGLPLVFIAPPNADAGTLAEIAKHGNCYTYLLSRAGVTGAEVRAGTPIDRVLCELKKHNAPPAVLGFGISEPAQVHAAISAGTAGAIAGSAVVKIIEKNRGNTPEMQAALKKFAAEMKAATLA